MFQTKGQKKSLEKDFKKMEVSDLPNREFKISQKDDHRDQ